MVALREFKEIILAGWPRGDAAGARVVPEQTWVDAGYQAPVVHAFCREAGERFRPAIGRGAAVHARQQAAYNRPTAIGSVVKYIGEGYHASWLPAEQQLLLEVDADHWKTWVHQRLATPINTPGAMTFYAVPDPQQQHLSLAKHLTAEAKVEEFINGKGLVVRWQRLRRQNHWLDALYNACAAGHACEVRLVTENVPKPPPRQPTSPEQLAQNVPWGPGWRRWSEREQVRRWTRW